MWCFNQLMHLLPFLSRRPQYQPLSLKRLQYLIDLGRVDTTQPIDLTQLVNARGVTVQPLKRDYGVQLVDEVTRFVLMLDNEIKCSGWCGALKSSCSSRWCHIPKSSLYQTQVKCLWLCSATSSLFSLCFRVRIFLLQKSALRFREPLKEP